MAELALLLLALGCGGGAGGGDTATSGDGGAADGGGTTDSGDTGADPAESDEALFRRAIAGEVEAGTALSTIADRGGLPVASTEGYLFGCTCGAGDWALAGDFDGWKPLAMQHDGDLWWLEVPVPDPDGSLYKFVQGGSDYQADPLARRYGYDDNGEYSLVRATAAHLERWLDVGGDGLDGRSLRVWLPDGGAFTHALYAQDGQNLFDPDAPWGGWQLQSSLPPELLVVGVDNTAARMDEYTHVTDEIDGAFYGGEADAYADLLTTIIRPKMEAAYGTALVNGVMGSSLGGLVSAHTVYRHPKDWDMAISLSGTMGWGSIGLNNVTEPELWAAAGHREVALYIDSGGGGSSCQDADGDGVPDDDPDSSDNYCENAWFRDLMLASGYVMDVDLWHWWEPGATHDEQAWADRVWRPLEIFAPL